MKSPQCLFALTLILLAWGCKQDPVPTAEAPVAAFGFLPADPVAGETIQFDNRSEFATTYVWDFGDGNTSDLASPQHLFAEPGTYAVSLMALGEGGEDQISRDLVVLSPDPIASFQIDQPTAEMGEEISFTNTSQHAENFIWYFGDGDSTTEVNPTHAYTKDGVYTVQLVAIGNQSRDSSSQSITIDTNFDGDWQATTTESDASLSSASLSFSLTGTDISVSNWSASTSFGYLFGFGWSGTLDENNSFVYAQSYGSLNFSYSISLTSSTTGTGLYVFNGQSYEMEVSRR